MLRRYSLLIAALSLSVFGGLLVGCDKGDQPKEHVHQYGEAVIVEPTCTEDGSKTRTCVSPDCNVEKDRVIVEVIPALGHDFGGWRTETAAKCEEGGTRVRVCNVCGERDVEQTSPRGHDWDGGVPVKGKEATCTAAGKALYTCNVCQKTEERDAPKLEHDFTVERTKNNSCTEEGEDTYTCKLCGAVEHKVVEALGHSYDAGKVTQEADCTHDGIRIQTCTRPGCGDVKETVTPKLNHSPEGEYTIDEYPDFGKAGSKSYHCLRCGDHLNPVVIPALEKGVPIEYEFRVQRNNGEKISAPGIVIEVFNSAGEKVATGSGSGLENGYLYKVMLEPEEYTVKISGLPEGYTAEPSYKVIPQDAVCRLYLTAAPLPAEDFPGSSLRYKVGDLIYDRSFTTITDETVTISGLLKTKKMILFNFWYVSCPNCVYEFPGMQEAYERFEKDVAIIAIDPYLSDTKTAVVNFAGDHGFTFYVVHDTERVFHKLFNVTGYPTSVIVDREGVISQIEVGGLVESDGQGGYTSTRLFSNLFSRYTSDDGWRVGSEPSAAPVQENERALPEKKKMI